MFCPKCGAQVDEKSSFCSNCGNALNSNSNANTQSVPAGTPAPNPSTPKTTNDKKSWKCKRCNTSTAFTSTSGKWVLLIIGMFIVAFILSATWGSKVENEEGFAKVLYQIVYYAFEWGAIGLIVWCRYKVLDKPCSSCGMPAVISMQTPHFEKKGVFHVVSEKINNKLQEYSWFRLISYWFDRFLQFCIKIFKKVDVFAILAFIFAVMTIAPYYRDVEIVHHYFDGDLSSVRTEIYANAVVRSKSKDFLAVLALLFSGYLYLPWLSALLNFGRVLKAKKLPLILGRIKFWMTIIFTLFISENVIGGYFLTSSQKELVDFSTVDFNGVRFQIVFFGLLSLVFLRLSYELEKKKWILANSDNASAIDVPNVDFKLAVTNGVTSVATFFKNLGENNDPNNPNKEKTPFAQRVKNVFNSITKKVSPKILIAVVAAILTIIIAIVIISVASHKDAFDLPNNTISVMYSSEENAYVVVENDKVLDFQIQTNNVSTQTSLDGKIALLLTSEGSLYMVKNSKVFEIDSDIDTALLSVQGKGIVYVNNSDELTLYSVEKEKATMRTIDVESDSIAISPDGETVAYIDLNDGNSYVSNSKKRTSIGYDLNPISVSNSGKYIYCYDAYEEYLYVSNAKGDKEKLADVSEETFFLNNDHTQIMFCDDDVWYIVEGDSDKARVSSEKMLYLIAPEASIIIANDISDMSVVTYPTHSFANHYYCYYDSSEGLVYLNKKYKVERIAEYVSDSNVQIDNSGETLYYIDYDEDCLMMLNSGKKAKTVAEDVYSFEITPDGKGVYYKDDSYSLWYQKGTGKAKEITDEVDIYYVTNDGIVLYLTDYSDTGVLYSSKNGGSSEHIADDVKEVNVTSTATYYYTDTSIYACKKGINFEILIEGNDN